MLLTLPIGKSTDLNGYNPLFAAFGALDVIRALVLRAMLVAMLRGREGVTTQ